MSDRHFFPLTGRPPCADCGQPEGVVLQISATGYSVGGSFEHRAECPRLRCAHGVLWAEDCGICLAAEPDEEGE